MVVHVVKHSIYVSKALDVKELFKVCFIIDEMNEKKKTHTHTHQNLG
jgi:transcriptional regulator of NAD metabolism